MSTETWRQFELLVAQIEEFASPSGAVVKSPDRIRDQTTGRLREVDASIRYTVGTAEILVTIECRERSRKADDTWIEQLATKQKKIGAAKTIAVSSEGFSGSAQLTAQQYGIDLRVLSEVSMEDIHDWFMPSGAVHIFRKIENMKCVVFFERSDGRPTENGYVVPDEFEDVFYHANMHSPFPAATLFHLHEIQHPESFSEVPFDGSLIKVEFAGKVPGVTVMGRDNKPIPVDHIQLSADVGYEVAVCDIETGEHHRYAMPEGEVQRTKFNATLFDLPFEFTHQSTPSGEPNASWRVLRGDDDEPES